MTIPANTVWEVQYGGDDTNGGGFVTGSSGTDYSQQTSPQWSVTDAVTNGTTTVTSATANFDSSIVGNVLYIVIGGTPYRRYVTTYTNSTTIVVDATLTTGSSLTMKVGGAVATCGSILAGSGSARIQSAGNIIFIKYDASNPTITVGSAYGFCFLAGTIAATNYIVGYDTTRTITNQDANRPTIYSDTYGYAFYVSQNAYTFVNLIFDMGNVLFKQAIYFQAGVGSKCIRCDFNNYYGSAATETGSATYVSFVQCKFSGNTANYSIGGVRITGGAYFENCEFVQGRYGLAAAATTGIVVRNCTFKGHVLSALYCSMTGGFLHVINCNFAGNTSHGLDISTATPYTITAENCIFYGNGGYGIYATSRKDVQVRYCAGGSNTSGDYNSTYVLDVTDFISLSGDPFTDYANNDWSLDTTAGEGADLRQAAYPSTNPTGGSTNYLDIGAIQNSSAGGSAGARLVGASALVTPGGHV